MSHSPTSSSVFATGAAMPLEATFDGGRLTSDGGLPWLAEAEADLGVCAAFARCLTDWRRDPARSRHSLETLVRQRVFPLACGYEDQDDADTLRADPLFKLVCGQLPVSGHDLASQPTLSRLETLRLTLLKIGGRIDEYADRVRLRLASSRPGQALWPILDRYRTPRE